MIRQYLLQFLALILLKGIFTSIETALKANAKKFIQQSHNESDSLTKTDKMSLEPNKYIIAANISKSVIIMFFGLIFFDVIVNLSDYLTNLIHVEKKLFSMLIYVFLFILYTYVIVLFGSVIPKKIASAKYEGVLNTFSSLLKFVYIIFSPFVYMIQFMSDAIVGIFGIKNADDSITQERIMQMIGVGEESGSIDQDEREMISNVFEFDDKIAGEIATHRKDIVAVDINASVDDIVKIVLEEKYSRIPVYEDSIDNIIGILHIKDFMKYVILYGKNYFDIRSLIMKPNFVPFSKKADELFREMQKDKVHLSIVIDEYGGTVGIVSMEDLVEVIMGSILDEYDDEECPEFEVMNEGFYRIMGTADLDEISENLNIEMPVDEYDTMSGFVIGQIGHIGRDPQTGCR